MIGTDIQLLTYFVEILVLPFLFADDVTLKVTTA